MLVILLMDVCVFGYIGILSRSKLTNMYLLHFTYNVLCYFRCEVRSPVSRLS